MSATMSAATALVVVLLNQVIIMTIECKSSIYVCEQLL